MPAIPIWSTPHCVRRIAGLGMVLAPEFIARDDLLAGRLCALPGSAKVLLVVQVVFRPGPAVRHTEESLKWLDAYRDRPEGGD